MFKKLISIQNYGRFSNFNITQSDWDGTFSKTNVIYAPNGFGKTSFSVMMRSISGYDALITKKTTFDTQGAPSIKFIVDPNKELTYNNGKWKRHYPQIEVFDSFYLEDNVYIISIDDNPERLNLFELPIASEITTIKQTLSSKTDELTRIRGKIKNKRYALKKEGLKKDEIEKNTVYLRLIKSRDTLVQEIADLERERLTLSEGQRIKYIEKINKYLSLFCDSLRLTKIKTFKDSAGKKQRLVYSLSIHGHEINIEQRENTSLKYYLSDGDKNALALSFFLAKFDLIPNKDKYTVIIDDPFTSFDTQRKTTTITQLARLSEQVEQLFLLTHDLYFANDFHNACTTKPLSLKITTKNNSSILVLNNLSVAMLKGFNKDLKTLRDFLAGNSDEDDLHLREVCRCIRPTIEGIFRIKYYNYIRENQWLGDFIALIRSSDPKSSLYRLKDQLEEIEEINEYSKIYHHSNPNYLEIPISPLELKNYVRRTLSLIEII